MAKKTVFISYDYDNDKHYKNLLLAWDANKEFDFSFYDASVDVSVDSNDAAAIKRVISTRINSATYFLCIVGEKTHKSKWVAWEIDKAVELKEKIIAVKTAKDNTTPTGLYGVGASWALSFTFDSIKKSIRQCMKNRRAGGFNEWRYCPRFFDLNNFKRNSGDSWQQQ